MKMALLFLGLFLALALVACVSLHTRLRRAEARIQAAMEQPEVTADTVSAPYELAAIDQYLYDRCCRYMTEFRPFLVNDFSLQDLANAVYTNKYYLSKTINRFSGKNFRQYVNYYRVMYAMDLFRENMSLRIAEMAQLCGFHSTTSFNQSFRMVMGETPSFWCSKIRKKQMDKLRK
ncbi:MAG: AraC family transcriptional regulator [Bacteroidales bacterium]|jgi:AraC-like DNA-binding protein|nr:AraC family transcriptional regulator [Bacteroidales bacterium]